MKISSKKLIVFIMVSLAIIIFQVGSVSAEEFDLKLNLQENNTYIMEMEMGQEIDFSMFGMEIYMHQSTDMKYNLEIKEITDDDNYLAEGKITNFVYKLEDYNFQDFSTEEEEQVKKEMNREMENMREAIENKPFEITFSRYGEMLDAEEYQELLKSLYNNDDEIMALEDEPFLSNWDYAIDYIPDSPVSIGESWEQTLEISTPMLMEIITNYTLYDISDDKIILDLDSNISMEQFDTSELMPAEDLTFNMNISGSQSGQINLERESRWIKESELKQNFSGELEMKEDGQESPFVIPMEATTIISTKGSVE